MEPLVELPCDYLRLKACRYGPMLYLSNDLYISRSLDLYGEYSEGEMELFRQLLQPGQTVLDVGANVGTHTVFFAKRVGPGGTVVSFEPQRLIFQVLCANVALNGLQNVFTHHAAVGQRGGHVPVPVPNLAMQGNFGALSLPRVKAGERVRLMTIDELELQACHLIKIDVEGMERDVLAGAEWTICRFRPLLYLEYEHDKHPTDLIEALVGFGYRVYRHVTPMFSAENFFQNRENVFRNVASFNLLGIHRSVAQSVEGLDEVASPK